MGAWDVWVIYKTESRGTVGAKIEDLTFFLVHQPRGLGLGREPAQTEREPTRVGKEPTCARRKSTYV